MGKFILKFLWLKKSIAVGLDQRVGDRTTPLTEFFFWPQCDAWEEMKNFLESKSWINQNDSIVLLNLLTEVVNEWQSSPSRSPEEISLLKEKFSDVLFVGFD